MYNLLAGGPNLAPAVQPVYDVVSVVLPIVLGIIFLVGVFKCISLGIAFSKSDENGTHEKAKKDLINAIIGFVLIFVLVAVMYLLRDIIIEWISGFIPSEQYSGFLGL